MDYKKFVYEQKKREKSLKSKATKVIIKEIRFGPNTDNHDYEFKKKHAEKFLKEGAKLKAFVFFKGRSIIFKEQGQILLLRLAQDLEEFGITIAVLAIPLQGSATKVTTVNKLKPPRNTSNLKGTILEKSSQVKGNFTLEAGPKNGTLYRANNKGEITSYATYDNKGLIIKRVDVTGDSHRGVETPHVVEYGRNTFKNSNGETVTRVQSPSSKDAPRPANSNE